MTCNLDYCEIHNQCLDENNTDCAHVSDRGQGLEPCVSCTNRHCNYQLPKVVSNEQSTAAESHECGEQTSVERSELNGTIG